MVVLRIKFPMPCRRLASRSLTTKKWPVSAVTTSISTCLDTESEFLLTIELPNGTNLKCLTHRLALLEAEREVAARSRDNDQCRFTANVGSSGRANPGAIAMRRR